MDFDFFKAPAGPDAGSAIHDALSATLAKGEAMSTGMIALQRYYAAKAERDQNERQFNTQMMLKNMLAQQQFDQSQKLEEGRMLRSKISDKRQEVGQLQAAGDRGARLAFDQEKETTRQQEVQAKATDAQSRSDSLDALLGPIMAQMGVKPGQTKGLTPGDKLGALNLAQRVQQDQVEQQRREAGQRADAEIRSALNFGIGTGELLQSEKVRGADLYDEFKGAQGTELQAAANEMFPTNPEAAKAWLKSMTSSQEIRYLDPQGWQQLQSQVGDQVSASGADSARVGAVGKQVLEGAGYRMGRDEAVMAARDALEKGHNAMLKRGRTDGEGSDPNIAKKRELELQKEDPFGVIAKVRERKKPLASKELTEGVWQWAEQQSEPSWSKDDVYRASNLIQSKAEVEPAEADRLRKQMAHVKRDAAKSWLISNGILDADDPDLNKWKKVKTLDEQIDDALGGAIPK